VFQRDNYTCQICGVRGGVTLNADHYPERFADIVRRFSIKSREEAYSIKEIWDISLGRTVCEDCHKKTDNFGIKVFNMSQ